MKYLYYKWLLQTAPIIFWLKLALDCDRAPENQTLRLVRLDHVVTSQPPKKGRGVGCQERLSGMPIYCFQLWMAVCAAQKSLLVHWCHWERLEFSGSGHSTDHWSGCLGYLSVDVGACWWQQQMQGPQGAAASSDKRSLSSVPVQERAATKCQPLSSAWARWWDESCCGHWQRH